MLLFFLGYLLVESTAVVVPVGAVPPVPESPVVVGISETAAVVSAGQTNTGCCVGGAGGFHQFFTKYYRLPVTAHVSRACDQ